MTGELTGKQALFVQEYLVDLNATQAAIRAGYSAKTAQEQSSRLLSKVMVAKAVAAGQAKVAAKLEIKTEDVVRELALLGFSNMMDYIRTTDEGDAWVDLSALTREQAAAIGEITVEDFTDGRGEDSRNVRKVKFKLFDKRSALESLGKHLGIFEQDNKQRVSPVIINGKLSNA